ncbi:hypothetical protein [Burkholderia ubonensis]|uniref:hypothetical protein n=2 Tax=Burkholderia ubonensis TaxID=101571 RepID=UPI00075DE2CC|nr:hypothetical protein [Burkholderia ubonensis]KVP38063.1 hypothetical protein WJ88_03770 [Burkholderia ubonensis]KWC65938.1 hypothetical protein WL54_04735 [Burkholderia ubonensis]
MFAIDDGQSGMRIRESYQSKGRALIHRNNRTRSDTIASAAGLQRAAILSFRLRIRHRHFVTTRRQGVS